MLTLDMLRALATGLSQTFCAVCAPLAESIRLSASEFADACKRRSARDVTLCALALLADIGLNIAVMLFCVALCFTAFYVLQVIAADTLYFARGVVYDSARLCEALASDLYALYTLLMRIRI